MIITIILFENMEKDKEKQINEDVKRLVQHTCKLLNDNYEVLLTVVPKELLSEMVVKNLSQYTTAYNDTRAKVLKAQIIAFWRSSTSFKLIHGGALLERFSDMWHKLSGSGFHFRIENILFKIIMVTHARGIIGERKAIELCHLNESAGVFMYDRKEVESYVTSVINKIKSMENNTDKKAIKK